MGKLDCHQIRFPVVFVLLLLLGTFVTLMLSTLGVYSVTTRMLSRQVATYRNSVQASPLRVEVQTTDRSAEKGNTTFDPTMPCPEEIQVTGKQVLNFSFVLFLSLILTLKKVTTCSSGF